MVEKSDDEIDLDSGGVGGCLEPFPWLFQKVKEDGREREVVYGV